MRREKKVFILHFNPIELYPPVLNCIRFLAQEHAVKKLYVVTTSSNSQPTLFSAPGVKIYRYGILCGKYPLYRYWQYVKFNAWAFVQLIWHRPQTVLYYETLSSFPALLYKRYVDPKANILVHYHEYMTRQEYSRGMSLVKFFHRLEKRFYPSFTWVSHTNEARLEKFIADHPRVLFGPVHVLPNYPPQSWISKPRCWHTGEVLRVVYIGSLGLHTMYIKEFCEWVNIQAGKVSLDIYSHHVSDEVKHYLLQLGSGYVRICRGASYDELPHILSNYHVGVILYKGHIPNFIYNAPNKLFEYLACGLDTWFPQEMLGSYPYIRTKTYPKVIKMDFEKLNDFDWAKAIYREDIKESRSEYYYEQVIGQLANSITESLERRS